MKYKIGIYLLLIFIICGCSEKKELPLSGKRIVFFGDSIIEGSSSISLFGGGNDITYWFSRRTGAEVVNLGISGTQAAIHSMSEYAPFSFCQIVNSLIDGDWSSQESVVEKINKKSKLELLKNINLADFDYCIIAYGHNDRSNGIDVGEPDSRDNHEFYGALNNAVIKLQKRYPQLHLVFIAPYNRPQKLDNPMLPYVNAIENVAERYSMPIVNLYKISGINSFTEKVYLEDGLHPKNDSKYGYEFIGNIVAAQILSFI